MRTFCSLHCNRREGSINWCAKLANRSSQGTACPQKLHSPAESQYKISTKCLSKNVFHTMWPESANNMEKRRYNPHSTTYNLSWCWLEPKILAMYVRFSLRTTRTSDGILLQACFSLKPACRGKSGKLTLRYWITVLKEAKLDTWHRWIRTATDCLQDETMRFIQLFEINVSSAPINET